MKATCLETLREEMLSSNIGTAFPWASAWVNDIRHHADIRRKKGKLPGLFHRNPTQFLPIFGRRFPFKAQHMHKVQINHYIRIAMAYALPGNYPRATYTQLFFHLPRQRLLYRFTGLLFTTGKFPIPGP